MPVLRNRKYWLPARSALEGEGQGVNYNSLGTSGLKVSELALGTMTFGEQNSLREAHEQLDYAVEQGVNFIDTAEMYPVPGKPETQGRSEEYVGKWL